MTTQDIWFSSDLHFYHKNVQKFCPETRSNGSLEEMNELIIQAHNAVVKPGDVFYHMGDFSFGTYDQTLEVLTRMNGIKKFYRGNHDQQLDKVLKSNPHLVGYYKDYAKEYINGKKIILCHFPIESFDGQMHGSLHIHGHLHGENHHECRIMKNRFDVGIDNRYDDTMAPFHFDEVMDRIEMMNIKLGD